MKEIYVTESKIAGRGLYVKEEVKKGEKICYIKGKVVLKVNRTLQDTLSNPDWVGISKHRWMDPDPPYKYLNHSCKPNTGISGTVTLYAMRGIHANEELTIDYSTIEIDPNWKLDGGKSCKCGNQNCRKVIRSLQFLPYIMYRKYLPYIPRYFQAIYLRYNRKN